MSKIPFTLDAWLKDKSQKVETRNGRPVHYIGLDRAGWQVFEVFRTNGTSEYRTYHDSYLYSGPGESTFDIFIVTPEPELSEFEKALEVFLMNADSSEETFHEEVKKHAAELLELAKKELCDQIVDHTKEAYENGKAEALKDLPRWKSDWKTSMVDKPDIVGKYLYYKEHKIRISDLEKLPGFKEDESYE